MAAKKSETRQRTKQVKVRCTADEFNAIAAKASEAGYTPPAYIRAAALGDAGPRAQRRLPVDSQLLRQALGLLGRYGNNMNQIAYQLNARGDRAGAAKYEDGLSDWAEIHAALIAALGKDKSPRP